MKKKVLVFVSVLIFSLLISSTAWALTAEEIRTLCGLEDAEYISQFIVEGVDYPVVQDFELSDDDEIMYDAIVVGPNGEEYIIIVVNGIVHILKK